MVDVCRARPPTLAREPELRRSFLRAVRRHRVAPLAHVLLRSTDAELATELKLDRDAALIRHLTATVVLEGLGEILGEIPWVTVKGPVLSEHAHPAPGLRAYNDVDVLVSPHDLRRVAELLLNAGWQVADYRDMLDSSLPPGEMHWVSPAGVLVDLHWSLINMPATRRRYAIPTDELLSRRVGVQVGRTPAWTLDPADSLLHVCLHAALTGADRMLWILDADQLARVEPDWASVVTRARAWRAAPAVAIVLGRARSLLRTPLPADLNRQLRATSGFRLVIGAADRVAPVPSLRRDASLARLVSRAARDGGGRTLAMIGRNGMLGFRDRIVPPRRLVPAGRLPADRGALETYLHAVESEVTQATER